MSEIPLTPTWTQNAIAVQISRDMALTLGMVQPTPQEAAERAQKAREYRAKVRASWEVYEAARTALAALSDPLARKVLDLHHSEAVERPTCEGCDMDGYECEPPEWPCRTVEAVAEVYGIALPDPLHLWRRPSEDGESL